ncbi:uncharacterized protein [Procambarus clarkii]|uniref:uncharacterized protein n=1 Tax=Procambarus clarkii TaxID=6728 RepID=UPI0037427400
MNAGCVVDSCCCCCELPCGTLAITIVHFIGEAAEVGFLIFDLLRGEDRYFSSAVSIAGLVVAGVYLLTLVCLLVGTLKERYRLMLAWLCLECCIIAVMGLRAITLFVNTLVLIAVLTLAITLLRLYFLVVVRSHILNLKYSSVVSPLLTDSSQSLSSLVFGDPRHSKASEYTKQ